MTLLTKDDMSEEEMAKAVAEHIIAPLKALLIDQLDVAALNGMFASGGFINTSRPHLVGGCVTESFMPRKSTETK